MSKTVRRVLMAGLVAFVVYPFSYAPLYRLFKVSPRATMYTEEASEPLWESAYRPVQLLLDSPYSWLSDPLLRWGDLWGVGWSMRADSMLRNPSANRGLLPVPVPGNPL